MGGMNARQDPQIERGGLVPISLHLRQHRALVQGVGELWIEDQCAVVEFSGRVPIPGLEPEIPTWANRTASFGRWASWDRKIASAAAPKPLF